MPTSKKSIRRKIMAIVAIVFALALVAAACGSDDDDDAEDTGQVEVTTPATQATEPPAEPGDDPEPEPGETQPPATPPSTTTTEAPEVATGGECTEDLKGGEITFGVFSETAGLDPTVSTGSGVTGMNELMAIYDILIRLDRNTGEYIPHLAESLEPNDDATVWTLGLREGITFGNGDPLNADAVIASIDRFNNTDRALGQGNQSGAFVSYITEMVAVDDLTVRFTLDEPWGTFPYTLADEPGMIVNVNVLNSFSDEENPIAAFSRNPVGAGAGPYEVERYAPGEEIVLRAKDDYWGGPVCIEKITFVRFAGASATYDAFQNDDVQAAFLREPRAISEARENGDENALVFLQNTGGVILINNGVRGSTPPTADVRLRRAIFLATDTGVMDQRANDGTGLPGKTLLSERSFYYDADLFPDFPTDADEARRLVEEVKAEGNWDGTIRLHCHNAPSRVDWAIAAEALLENAGFEVEVINDGTIQDLIGAVIIQADYDLACWGFNLADDTPYIPVLQHTCTSRSNRTGYCSEDMDAAIASLRAAGTYAETQRALADIWEEWQETVPSVSYETIEEYILFKDNIRGVIGTQASGVLFHDAYIEQ